MDKYKVKISPRAIGELDSIYKYIANEKLAPENAKGQVDRIKTAVLNPDTFRPINSVMRAGMAKGVTDSCCLIIILLFSVLMRRTKQFMW